MFCDFATQVLEGREYIYKHNTSSSGSVDQFHTLTEKRRYQKHWVRDWIMELRFRWTLLLFNIHPITVTKILKCISKWNVVTTYLYVLLICLCIGYMVVLDMNIEYDTKNLFSMMKNMNEMTHCSALYESMLSTWFIENVYQVKYYY